MRIGIMLRELDAQGGVSVYAHNLTRELLDIDRRNEYVLFYRSRAQLGRFGSRENVTERVIRLPSALVTVGRYALNLWDPIWDQIAMPIACWRERLDLVFHPKFTVPLLAPCKAAMVVHGADWFIPEQARYYHKWDVRQVKLAMPWYFRKASVVLSVSRLTTDAFMRVLGVGPDKIKTVYFGPSKQFGRVQDPEVLAGVKARYRLPDRFVLTLSKYGGGGRKNFGNLIEAYRIFHERTPAPPPGLVVGGKDCERFRAEHGIPEDGYGRDVVFPGWIDQRDLPAVYSLADLYLYPSNLEAFPIPLTEAMTCGTPIVTSDVNGLEEIAGDAALLVDPGDPADIAGAIERVVADPGLRRTLSDRGVERARRFTWERCGQETLRILESLGPCRSEASREQGLRGEGPPKQV